MIDRILAGLDRRANPILVKEMYQAAHSRLFMISFWILLAGALLIYGVSSVGANRQEAGPAMFWLFTMLMTVMVFIVIPFQAFLDLYNQVSSQTLELVQITGIHSRRLVRGCLMAAGVKVLLVFALIAPFGVASFLFGGVDLMNILVQAVFLFTASLIVCALSLAFGSLAVYPKVRTLARWAYPIVIFSLVPLIFYFFLYGSMSIMRVRFRIPSYFYDPDPLSSLIYTVGVIVLGALTMLFLAALAANALTFPHDRSSARAKVMALVIVAVLGVLMILESIFEKGSNDETMLYFQHVSCFFLGACGLMWITADRHVPHRHQAAIDRTGPFKLRLNALFGDGMVGTTVYLFLGALLVIVFAAAHRLFDRWSPSYSRAACYPVPFMLVSVLYLSALTRAFERLLPERLRTLTGRRMILLTLLAAMVFITLFYQAYTHDWPDAHSGTVMIPPMYLCGLGLRDGPPFLLFTAHLAVPFVIGFAWHAAQWRTFMPDRTAAGRRVGA